MKHPDPHNDNPFDSFRKSHELTESVFEDQLVVLIRFWKCLGRPDYETLMRLMIWEQMGRNRQATAEFLGLSGREAIRQMLLRLKHTYQENTISNCPKE